MSDYQITEIAQNRYTRVIFNTEHENDTPRCHIPFQGMNMSHPKKGIKLQQKIFKIAQNGIPGILFDAEHE